MHSLRRARRSLPCPAGQLLEPALTVSIEGPFAVATALCGNPLAELETINRVGPPIDLGLAHPFAHRLGTANPEQTSDLTDRRPLRIVLSADLSDHPHRPLPQLRRIPPRRTTCHDSNPPNKWSLRTSLGLFTYSQERPTLGSRNHGIERGIGRSGKAHRLRGEERNSHVQDRSGRP